MDGEVISWLLMTDFSTVSTQAFIPEGSGRKKTATSLRMLLPSPLPFPPACGWCLSTVCPCFCSCRGRHARWAEAGAGGSLTDAREGWGCRGLPGVLVVGDSVQTDQHHGLLEREGSQTPPSPVCSLHKHAGEGRGRVPSHGAARLLDGRGNRPKGVAWTQSHAGVTLRGRERCQVHFQWHQLSLARGG